MDVGDWLRSLGLGQYETLFRQNDIDSEVLSELTEGDLEKFGVSFGHQKRLNSRSSDLGRSCRSRACPPASGNRGGSLNYSRQSNSRAEMTLDDSRSKHAEMSFWPSVTK